MGDATALHHERLAAQLADAKGTSGGADALGARRAACIDDLPEARMSSRAASVGTGGQEAFYLRRGNRRWSPRRH
eukprot:7899003-Pyramimonas_sp.AAC.1